MMKKLYYIYTNDGSEWSPTYIHKPFYKSFYEKIFAECWRSPFLSTATRVNVLEAIWYFFWIKLEYDWMGKVKIKKVDFKYWELQK